MVFKEEGLRIADMQGIQQRMQGADILIVTENHDGLET
jgi:hypothetical protein